MSDRVVNFAAGPAILPQPVLEEVRRDLLSLPGVGVSALEISHRGPWFEGVIAEAEANLRALLGDPRIPPRPVLPGRSHAAVLDGGPQPPARRRPGGRPGDHGVVGNEGGEGSGNGWSRPHRLDG